MIKGKELKNMLKHGSTSGRAKSINDKVLHRVEFSRYIAELYGYKKGFCKDAVDVVISGIISAIENGYDVELSQVGTFFVSKINARKGAIPSIDGTYESVIKPTTYAARFRPGKTLSEAAKRIGYEKFGMNEYDKLLVDEDEEYEDDTISYNEED